jgi:hypothetical protein
LTTTIPHSLKARRRRLAATGGISLANVAEPMSAGDDDDGGIGNAATATKIFVTAGSDDFTCRRQGIDP